VTGGSAELIPISELFYDDAGPHVVSADSVALNPARFAPARGRELQDLLGTSIAQLGGVSGVHRRTPSAPAPVAIESLLYHGRAALDRAIEIGTELRQTDEMPDRETIEELLDLIQLAVEE